ncbi:MAG: ribonuclease H-like domain-containing protein [Chloroflexota bacterium]|nr:ribonuclease H-like domain-containing protein [Chloroflexota bacterium]
MSYTELEEVMTLAAFDLEIAKGIPEDVADWRTVSPLGISCASVAFSDSNTPLVRYGVPQMTREECRMLVQELQELVAQGYTIVTWNGCSFDFPVLAEESGLYTECVDLAVNHVDLMLIVTFTKGWFLSLQKALDGARLGGKVKTITLSNGTVLKDMEGSKAPDLWSQGEHEAVLTYLQGDVEQLIKLAEVVKRDGTIRWTARSGNPQSVRIDRLMTVKECFSIPEPDVSWMTNPPSRQQFVQWMEPYHKPSITQGL